MATQKEQQRQKIYRVVLSKSYRKDLKRVKKSGKYDLEKLKNIIAQLAEGKELHPLYFNHKLKGDLEGCEECHIRGDWLLVYRRRKDLLILILLATGTHAQVFEE